MYLNHFGLDAKPFSLTPDLRFVYATEGYDLARKTLLAELEKGTDFVLLRGQAGSGKTQLLLQLMADLRPSADPIFIPFTGLSFEELVSYICDGLEIGSANDPLDARLSAFAASLDEHPSSRGAVVLLIDSSENLADDLLARLPELPGIGNSHLKLVQVVLAGPAELEERLAQADLSVLAQRIEMHVSLPPMGEHEVGDYIRQRLRVAGAIEVDLFDDDAITCIAGLTAGVPRLINRICEQALQLAAGEGLSRVDADIIAEAYLLERKDGGESMVAAAEGDALTASDSAKSIFTTRYAELESAFHFESHQGRIEAFHQRLEQELGPQGASSSAGEPADELFGPEDFARPAAQQTPSPQETRDESNEDALTCAREAAGGGWLSARADADWGNDDREKAHRRAKSTMTTARLRAHAALRTFNDNIRVGTQNLAARWHRLWGGARRATLGLGLRRRWRSLGQTVAFAQLRMRSAPERAAQAKPNPETIDWFRRSRSWISRALSALRARGVAFGQGLAGRIGTPSRAALVWGTRAVAVLAVLWVLGVTLFEHLSLERLRNSGAEKDIATRSKPAAEPSAETVTRELLASIDETTSPASGSGRTSPAAADTRPSASSSKPPARPKSSRQPRTDTPTQDAQVPWRHTRPWADLSAPRVALAPEILTSEQRALELLERERASVQTLMAELERVRAERDALKAEVTSMAGESPFVAQTLDNAEVTPIAESAPITETVPLAMSGTADSSPDHRRTLDDAEVIPIAETAPITETVPLAMSGTADSSPDHGQTLDDAEATPIAETAPITEAVPLAMSGTVDAGSGDGRILDDAEEILVDGEEMLSDTEQPQPETAPTPAAPEATTAQSESGAIATLLARATELHAAEQLTVPEGDNALEVYRKVLALAPTEARAIEGVRAIKAQFVTWGVEAEANGDLAKAQRQYRKALYVDPDDAAVKDELERLARGRARATSLARNDADDAADESTARTVALQVTESVSDHQPQTGPQTGAANANQDAVLLNDGNKTSATTLIEQGANTHATTKEGERALMIAAKHGDSARIRTLIQAGADPNRKNDSGDTPLMQAAWNNHGDAARELVAAGGEVDVKNSDGWTPLVYAAINGHIGVVRLLLTAGADVNATNNESQTALAAAAWNGHTATVELLIAAGADLDLKDRDGWTALMKAAWNGNDAIVKTLLANGADPRPRSQSGDTALMLAHNSGHRHVAALLDQR